MRKNRAEVIDMVLNEYDQEFHIKTEKEISFEEGRYTTLVDLVCRKLRKGKTPETIAEELDEDLTVVTFICKAARTFAPDYDYLKVFHTLSEQRSFKTER